MGDKNTKEKERRMSVKMSEYKYSLRDDVVECNFYVKEKKDGTLEVLSEQEYKKKKSKTGYVKEWVKIRIPTMQDILRIFSIDEQRGLNLSLLIKRMFAYCVVDWSLGELEFIYDGMGNPLIKDIDKIMGKGGVHPTILMKIISLITEQMGKVLQPEMMRGITQIIQGQSLKEE